LNFSFVTLLAICINSIQRFDGPGIIHGGVENVAQNARILSLASIALAKSGIAFMTGIYAAMARNGQ
jgi:hypothetical protein